ncbi:MAG: serine kinase, partial [Sedimentibacter sp.]
LLSIVMSKAKQNFIWVTIQTHINIIAVAELLDLACIIIVENMNIEKDALEKAKELGIPIYKTEKSAYQVSCDLCNMGIE